MAFVDATIVNIAFPDIRQSFPETTIAGLSWVLNAYNIVFAAFLVAAGSFADLLGRKRTFEAGLVLFTFASALCALATSPTLLIAARVVQALGAAVVVPASLALVLEAFPAGERTHAVALWTAVAALAAGVGPSLGGLLVELGGWRLAFLVNIPVGIAAVMLARSRLVESRAPGRRRLPDVAGALLFALAVATVTLALVKGNEWGWTSAATLGTLAAGLLLGGVFARRCSRHAVPLFDLELLRVRGFSVANVLTVVGAAGFFAYTLCNVLFLTAVWEYSVLQAGLALTPGPFVAVALASAGSRLAERVGLRAVIVPGAAVWGLGVLYLVAFVGPEPDFLGEWLPGMVLLGIGAGLAFPNLSAAAVSAAPGERFATATALNSVARQLGAVLGVALLVAIVGTPAPTELASAFDAGWMFAAGCLLAASVGALALGPSPQVPAPEVEAAAVVRAPTVARAPAATVAAAPVVAAAGGAETPADLLARSPIFARLPAAIRAELAARGTEVELGAGEWLFREGDPGDSLYVVRLGRLEVVREGGEPATIRTLARGEVVGELALLTEDRRSASVRARRDSVLLRIDEADFAALLREEPEVAVALTRVLGEQLKESRALPAAVRPTAVTVAVVPLDAGVAAGPLADRIAAALGAYGRVARLDASAGGREAYAPLVDRAERGHDHVVLAAGDPADAWTGFCLSHADRILAVTSGGPVPPRVPEALRGCDLVGLDVQPGSGALGPWVEALDPAQAHVLRSDDGVGRLARRLAGRSVGVVLSGGGARAFAHLGVLEELRAAGVDDRPRRRRQHGRVHRRDARRRDGRRRDGRPLLRGVDAPLAAVGLHPAALLADPRRAVPGDAGTDVRRDRDRGARVRLPLRERRPAQRHGRLPPLRAALGAGRDEHVPAGARDAATARQGAARRRLDDRQPARPGAGGRRRGPDRRGRRQGRILPVRRPERAPPRPRRRTASEHARDAHPRAAARIVEHQPRRRGSGRPRHHRPQRRHRPARVPPARPGTRGRTPGRAGRARRSAGVAVHLTRTSKG